MESGGVLDGRHHDFFSRALEAGKVVTFNYTAANPIQIEIRTGLTSLATSTSSTAGQFTFTAPSYAYYEFLVIGSTGNYTLTIQ